MTKLGIHSQLDGCSLLQTDSVFVHTNHTQCSTHDMCVHGHNTHKIVKQQLPPMQRAEHEVSAKNGLGQSTEETAGVSGILMQACITGTTESSGWCCKATLTSTAFIVALIIMLVFGCRYVSSAVIWLEQSDTTVSVVVLSALFIIVCFPVAWGLSPLMVTAGYIYGLLYGPVLVTLSVTAGLALSTAIMRLVCSGYLTSLLYSSKVEVFVNVVSGPHGLKIIAISRLTPIPFGLQNALFSLSSIPLSRYLVSSMCGLTPMTFLNCYMGSTVRNIQDLVAEDSSSVLGFLIFGSQILITLVLFWFIVDKAKTELKKAMDQTEQIPSALLCSCECSDNVTNS